MQNTLPLGKSGGTCTCMLPQEFFETYEGLLCLLLVASETHSSYDKVPVMQYSSKPTMTGAAPAVFKWSSQELGVVTLYFR